VYEGTQRQVVRLKVLPEELQKGIETYFETYFESLDKGKAKQTSFDSGELDQTGETPKQATLQL
jgi:hypothetical protein